MGDMNMFRKRLLTSILALSVVLTAAGCGGSASSSEPSKTADPGSAAKPSGKAVSNDPVSLLVYLGADVSDEDFKLLFADPVKKKYPNITLTSVKPAKGTTINELIASGTIPDIITTPNADMLGYKQQDLLYDIAPLLKENKIDLNRFQQPTIDAVKSDKGEVWAVPYAMQFDTMYYNKDVFDKFGVPYPKDGMTWEDAIELGKKVTRKDGNVQYRGLDVVSSYLMSFPFALPYVDGKTNKSAMGSDKWKRVFELTKTIQTIPGNEPPKPEPGASTEAGYFIKDKNIGMLVSVNLMTQMGAAGEQGLNWDIAQYPSYKESPNVSGKVDSHNLAIAKTTKHKEDAIKVLEVVTSDEVQLMNVRKTARMSPLKTTEVQKQYGADLAYLKGKNLQAIFKSKIVAAPDYTPYEIDGKKIAQAVFRDYLAGKIDLNTALRQADEQINQMISTK
jgi:multiple sugar transport system substrate-binding protein